MKEAGKIRYTEVTSTDSGRYAEPAAVMKSKPKYMLDNLAAGTGELPDLAMQKRMVEFIGALLQA